MQYHRFTIPTIALMLTLGITACGGGGSSPPAAAVVGVQSAATVAVAAPLTIAGFGGLKGATYTAHTDNSVYDYAEDVTIDFNKQINGSSLSTSTIVVTPTAPWTTYLINYGKRVQLTIQKKPGVTYTMTFKPGIQATDGTTLAASTAFHFSTSATVTIPARLRATPGNPYRYGVLTHPTPDSLGGPNATTIANLLQTVHAGFARIDYPAGLVMPTPTTFNFTEMDSIVAMLAARGITALPILDQYDTAPWQSDKLPYPNIFSSPTLYANYVGAVVAHLRTTAPQITRIELFNEPNLTGWWTSPNPTYAATNGSATAQYMLAAYKAAKQANPAITVVGPGLAAGGSEVDPRTFFTQLYTSGCRVGVCWDVVSIHPYSWMDPTYTIAATASNRWQVYQDLQAIAVAHGDPVPHVMLTEWAYSTANVATGFDPNVQALYMAKGFNLMLADPTIDGMVWTTAYATGTDFWSRTAFTQSSFALEPAALTFEAFAGP